GDPLSREIPDPADVAEELGRRQVLGEGWGLGHVAELRLVADRIHEHVVASHAHDSVVRPQQPDEDLQRRRLAGAVRADEPEDFALPGLKAQALESWCAFIGLPKLLYVNSEGHGAV